MLVVDSQVHIWGADTPQRPWPKRAEPQRVDRMEDLGLPTCSPRTTWCTPNTIMHFGSKVSARVPDVPRAAEFSQVQE
jgi:hypothetical protein